MPSQSFRRRVTAAVATLVIAGIGTGLTGAPAQAAPTPKPQPAPTSGQQPAKTDPAKVQTFGIGPANAKGLDRRQAFVYAARPGTVIKDRVAVLNYTYKPLKVKVYASDAFTSQSGAFDVLPAVDKPNDLGAWTSLKPRVITLPARAKSVNAQPSQVVLPFSVKVPRKAAAGDHAAGIVVSTNTKPVGARANTTGIVVDRRVGTRMYLRVPGALDPSLAVENLSVSYLGTWNPVQPGKARVDYQIRNTGNVALSASQRVAVQGLLGTSATSAPLPDVVQVLPGDAVTVSTVVDNVWPTFRVTGTVELDPYSGTPDAKEKFPTVSASASTWAIPWALLVLILVLAVTTWVIVRRRRRPAADDPVEVEERDEVLVP